MSGKEITEKAARIAYSALPEEAIERIAVAIWNASPSGELWHVTQLAAMLNTPDAPVAEYVKALRNVQAVADEWANVGFGVRSLPPHPGPLPGGEGETFGRC